VLTESTGVVRVQGAEHPAGRLGPAAFRTATIGKHFRPSPAQPPRLVERRWPSGAARQATATTIIMVVARAVGDRSDPCRWKSICPDTPGTFIVRLNLTLSSRCMSGSARHEGMSSLFKSSMVIPAHPADLPSAGGTLPAGLARKALFSTDITLRDTPSTQAVALDLWYLPRSQQLRSEIRPS